VIQLRREEKAQGIVEGLLFSLLSHEKIDGAAEPTTKTRL
jgi:hypothetical protein